MKVVLSRDNLVVFSSGLVIEADGAVDCCVQDYMDFEQFTVGREFPDMTLEQLRKNIKVHKDGIALKDIHRVPAWGQARSIQNGWYSSNVDVYIRDGDNEYELANLEGVVEYG